MLIRLRFDPVNDKNGALMGYAGALHPALMKKLALKNPVFLFEIPNWPRGRYQERDWWGTRLR